MNQPAVLRSVADQVPRRARHAARPRPGKHAPSELRAAELAWALLRLIELGIRARSAGWCLGELRSGEVVLDAAGWSRAAAQPGLGGWLRGVEARARRGRHLRRGHDSGCHGFGVPVLAADRLLTRRGRPSGAPFVRDLYREAVAELSESGAAGQRWAGAEALETAEYTVRRRITPMAPGTAAGGAR